MPELRPTDDERARWQDAIATDLNGLDWYERRDDLIDAIFTAGAKAAQAGTQVVWGTRDPADGFCSLRNGEDAARKYATEHGHDLIAYRTTGWRAADDA